MQIYAWGCGKYAEEAIKQMKIGEIEINGVIDKNSELDNFCGYSIYSVDWLKKNNDKIGMLIITSIKYKDEIFGEALSCGVQEKNIRFWDCSRGMYVVIRDSYSINVFSQDGEECYLRDKFAGKQKGFYVDVGAHHPYRFSNTMWAYERGWRGLNIEPNGDMFQLFPICRPRDINLNIGISDGNSSMLYYKFEEPALNTFDKQMANLYIETGSNLIDTPSVEVKKLNDVLNEYRITEIDFMNIDVEGLEMRVLSTLDFQINIGCILLEQVMHISDLLKSKEYLFLRDKGYDIAAIFGRSVIYEKI